MESGTILRLRVLTESNLVDLTLRHKLDYRSVEPLTPTTQPLTYLPSTNEDLQSKDSVPLVGHPGKILPSLSSTNHCLTDVKPRNLGYFPKVTDQFLYGFTEKANGTFPVL